MPPLIVTGPVPKGVPLVAVVLTRPPLEPLSRLAALSRGTPPMVRELKTFAIAPAVAGLNSKVPEPVLVSPKAPAVTWVTVKSWFGITSMPLAAVKISWRGVVKLDAICKVPPAQADIGLAGLMRTGCGQRRGGAQGGIGIDV